MNNSSELVLVCANKALDIWRTKKFMAFWLGGRRKKAIFFGSLSLSPIASERLFTLPSIHSPCLWAGNALTHLLWWYWLYSTPSSFPSLPELQSPSLKTRCGIFNGKIFLFPLSQFECKYRSKQHRDSHNQLPIVKSNSVMKPFWLLLSCQAAEPPLTLHRN